MTKKTKIAKIKNLVENNKKDLQEKFKKSGYATFSGFMRSYYKEDKTTLECFNLWQKTNHYKNYQRKYFKGTKKASGRSAKKENKVKLKNYDIIAFTLLDENLELIRLNKFLFKIIGILIASNIFNLALLIYYY